MVVHFGPGTKCTLETCSIKTSIYQYRPSLGANSALLALFALALIIHLVQGIKWKSWPFMIAAALGCITEIIGYAGRIMLYQNPFSFNAFLIQIVCLTFGPAFFSAAIYLTLSKIITYLGPQYSRFSPKLYYWVFIGCDLVSITLQGAGGGLSSSAGQKNNNSQTGVDIAMAGLSFQVFSLAVFICLAADYFNRRRKALKSETVVETKPKFTTSFKVFLFFLSLAMFLILIRCAYRIDELSDGYTGPLIHDQVSFIVLEGVMVIVACFALNVAHPGMAFSKVSTAYDGELDPSEKGACSPERSV